MYIKKGDYVTRDSYNNDTIFKVIKIHDGICYLKGVEVRLYADSPERDLKLYKNEDKELKIDGEEVDDLEIKDKLLNRTDYFYLPAKILHIDGDEEYLNRCLKFYKKNGILAIGKKINEKHIYEQMKGLLLETRHCYNHWS